MANGQKAVLTMLVAILLLEFGSLTKLQTIWSLAFGKEYLANAAPTPGTGEPVTSSATIQIQTPTHPEVQL